MQSDNSTRSLWMKDKEPWPTRKLETNLSADVCVIGAGIAGLTTAYLLLKEGRTVVVLDKDNVAEGESSRTTGHLVNVLDDRFYKLQRAHGNKGARLAASSHSSAISLIEEIVNQENISCDFSRVNGYLFAAEGRPKGELKKELKAMHEAGLYQAVMERKAPIGTFDTGPCIRANGQGKLHPMKYFYGLAKAIQEKGGNIFTGTMVNKIEGGENALVGTTGGFKIKCRHIVVAANTPINDMVAIHIKQAPYRTYVITAQVPHGTLEDALYWDTGDPYHYLRTDPDEKGNMLLTVGGEDHKTGQEKDPEKCFRALERWVRARFPIGEIRYKWSGQVLEPIDGLAYIGRNPHDHKNVYIITGDSGNGMTHGTIGGMLVTDLIAGKKNRWEKLYDPSRAKSIGTGIRENLNVAVQYLDWLTPGDDLQKLAPGTGIVIRKGLHKVALHCDLKGQVHALDATCTHLGCVVNWNGTENSWDCPCHGSRFSPTGQVISGPATRKLAPFRIEQDILKLHKPKLKKRAMAKYSKKSQDTVESAMRRRKRGTLRSGSGKKVTSRKQAIAIGLSEAREKGAKVPNKRGNPASRRRAASRRKKS
jgi:glycine/D-amino acid oxidase-like deaminating enzyme/nitrite reductase/ring-hydroxylating ferredoxin subunit